MTDAHAIADEQDDVARGRESFFTSCGCPPPRNEGRVLWLRQRICDPLLGPQYEVADRHFLTVKTREEKQHEHNDAEGDQRVDEKSTRS